MFREGVEKESSLLSALCQINTVVSALTVCFVQVMTTLALLVFFLSGSVLRHPTTYLDTKLECLCTMAAGLFIIILNNNQFHTPAAV